MLTANTVKTYSIPISKFTKIGFEDLISDVDLGIDLGIHGVGEVYTMSEYWPILEYSQDFGWGVVAEPSMEILPREFIS